MIYIFGASGHGKVVLSVFEAIGKKVSAFIDQNTDFNECAGLKVIHHETFLSESDQVILGIGNNQVRKELANRLSATYLQAIHPEAFVYHSAQIGEGTVIMAKSCIQVDTIIGKHCIINTGSCIDHECELEDFVHVSPNATLCGNVSVGEGTWIGAGATVIQGVKIGKWATIGAGSVILKDVPDGATVVGVPGQKI